MSDSLWRDVRSGVRGLVRSPGFTLVAVVGLGLGIGAAGAIYSVADAVLFTPLPFPEPERLVLLGGTHQEEGGLKEWPISYLDFADWQERQQSFTALALFTDARSFNLAFDGEAEQVRGEMVSAAYFSLLGVEPARGRVFTPEEDRRGDPQRLVVLADELWRTRFGGDPAVVGQTLILNEESYQVLGVMPPGFAGLSDQAQLFTPITLASAILGAHYVELRPFRWLTALGRLAPGVRIEQARQSLGAVAAALAAEYPDTNEGVGVRLQLLREAGTGDLRPALLVLLACAGLVLLLICANLANLLLARGAARGREMAVRTALGAGRGRLVRQLLIESALLALAGGALGLLLASWGTPLLAQTSGIELPSFIDLGLDLRVVGVMLATALLCGLLFGLAPAVLAAGRGAAALAVRAGRGEVSAGRQRFQSALVVAQVALALVLVAGAALTAQSLQRLSRVDLGFRPQELLTARLDLKGPSLATPEAKQQLIARLRERLTASPVIGALALSGPAMPGDDWSGTHFTIEERRGEGSDDLVLMGYHLVSPGYFQALGIPLRRGREFNLQDAPGTPLVAVVNKATAQRFWPGADAVGKRLKFGRRDAAGSWIEVVGVVGDVRHAGRRGDARPPHDVYLTVLQAPPTSPPTLNLLARPAGISAGGLTAVLRDEVRAVAPGLPLYDVATMEERLGRELARERFSVLLTSLFAALALLLALLGIYGVTAYTVTRRRREIGVRMALGAAGPRVVREVAAQGGRLALLGVVLGLAAVLALARLAAGLIAGALQGVSASDPLILAGTALLLLATALLASYLPARRAARIEPAATLRVE